MDKGLFGVAEKKSHPVERMMVAFNGVCSLVLFYAGLAIHSDIEGVGAGELGFNNPMTPDHGVWVWEGVPKAVYCGEEFDRFEYAHLGWRAPTSKEWAGLMGMESPWPWEPNPACGKTCQWHNGVCCEQREDEQGDDPLEGAE